MNVTRMQRYFKMAGGARLPDPNPAMTVEDVRAFYATQFPEITTATVSGPEAVGDKLVYTFEISIGSKG